MSSSRCTRSVDSPTRLSTTYRFGLSALCGERKLPTYPSVVFGLNIHTGIPTNERVAAQGIVGIENWNDRVWGITQDGKLYDTFALSNSWEFQSAIPVHETPVQNMFIYRDVSGEPVIHVLTETALWIHDHGNQRFLKTDVTFPRSPRNGLGAVVWRGDLYISAGLSVYRYGGGGAPVLSLVGPDRDQGVSWPGESMIVKLVPTHNRLLAAIQNLENESDAIGTSHVLAYDSVGWQSIWTSGDDHRVLNDLFVSTIFGEYSAWIGHDDLEVIDLPIDIINPWHGESVPGALLSPRRRSPHGSTQTSRNLTRSPFGSRSSAPR